MKKISKIQFTMDTNSKKYVFFLKRTIIRGIGKYYKKKFQAYRQQNKIKFELKDVKDLAEIWPYLYTFAA